MAGKRLSLVHFAVPFARCRDGACTYYRFPTLPLTTIRAQGAIPLLSFSSQSVPTRPDEPAFSLADVISGRFDAYLTGFARAARQWGHPFFLRCDWDMNGSASAWSEAVKESGTNRGRS